MTPMHLSRKPINKRCVVCVILLGVALNLFSSTLVTVYQNRLETSSAYQNLLLQVGTAKQALAAYSDIFDPYLTMNFQPGGLTFNKTVTEGGGNQNHQLNLNMSADLKLFHVLGTSIGLSFPAQYTINNDGESDFVMNSLGLTLSRKLISEEQAQELGIKAQYFNALHAKEQQEWALFIHLVTDIFNQKYYEGLEAVNQKRLEIYNIQYDNALDEDRRDAYLQQKLLAQKALLNTQKMLEQIRLFTPPGFQTLYDQMKTTLQKMYDDYLQFPVCQPSRKIQALELEVEKALAEKKLWFLPYLYNPTLSFSLEYYFDDTKTTGFQGVDFDWSDFDFLPDDFTWPDLGYQAGDFKWSIGVTGSLDIFDRGERQTEAFKRENTYNIKLLELNEEKERIEQELRKMIIDIEISKVDLQIKELEFEGKMEDAEKSLTLYQEGFITLEDKQLALLALEQSRLDYIQALHQLYLHQLALLQESGISLGGYLNEDKK